MDDKWIDSIRDKMTEYEVAPPDSLLESVQGKIRALRTRRKRVFLAIAASITLIGILSLALIPNIEKGNINKEMVSERSEVVGEKESVNVIVNAAVISENSCALPRSRGIAASTSMTAVSDTEDINFIEVNDKDGGIQENLTRDKDIFTETYTPSKQMEDYHDMDCPSEDITMDFRSRKQSTVSAGVSASANGLGGLFEEENIGSRPGYASTSLPLTRMGCGVITPSLADDNQPPTFVEFFHHKLPARFSIDFSWPVYHNVYFGAGICYSYLRSDIRYGYSDSRLYKASQNLHFIGIPVNLRYNPWNFRKLDIYATVGFMAEKCIGGEIKEENPQDPEYLYAGYDERPFQFSFSAAVGAQYYLSGKCAVYIEPGVGVYLKNGSGLRTIYSERPLTFNVNVGFRFGHLQ